MSGQKKNTVLMLGDSLIEWGDWDTLLPDMRVINRGVAGEHTEDLSARLVEVVDNIREPNHILLMSGTNNLLMGNSFFSAILIGMLPRLKSLCPKSVITLNSIMPMRFKGLAEEAVTAINLELRDIAERNDCCFLDMVKPFTEQCLPITKPCFLNDGVHLSTRGYQVWAREIRRHLGHLR